MRESISILRQQNIKKIDSVLERASDAHEEARENKKRLARLRGEQGAFLDNQVRNLPSDEREKILNQFGDPRKLLEPRLISKEEASQLSFANDAGTHLIRPFARGERAPEGQPAQPITQVNLRMARPDLSKDKNVQKAHELHARNVEIQKEIARRTAEVMARFAK